MHIATVRDRKLPTGLQTNRRDQSPCRKDGSGSCLGDFGLSNPLGPKNQNHERFMEIRCRSIEIMSHLGQVFIPLRKQTVVRSFEESGNQNFLASALSCRSSFASHATSRAGTSDETVTTWRRNSIV